MTNIASETSVQDQLKKITYTRYNSLLENQSTKKELESVAEKSTKLFLKNHLIDTDTTELFRAMCILSQCGSKTVEINSHRPFFGKIIVGIKKLMWKIVEPQIRPIFNGVSDCFSYLIKSHAALIQRVHELEIKHEDKN